MESLPSAELRTRQRERRRSRSTIPSNQNSNDKTKKGNTQQQAARTRQQRHESERKQRQELTAISTTPTRATETREQHEHPRCNTLSKRDTTTPKASNENKSTADHGARLVRTPALRPKNTLEPPVSILHGDRGHANLAQALEQGPSNGLRRPPCPCHLGSVLHSTNEPEASSHHESRVPGRPACLHAIPQHEPDLRYLQQAVPCC